jgi:ATP-dependent DNA helicase RecQ
VTWTGAKDPRSAAEEAAQAEEAHRQVERSRVEMMRNYAETRDCRRQVLLNYFGEPFQDPCEGCDNCDAGLTIPEDRASQPFSFNSRVRHERFGDGLVVRYEGADKVVVLFDEAGYRMLAVEVVAEGGIIEPIDAAPPP